MRDIKFRLWHKSIKQMLHFDNVIGIMDNKDRHGIFLPSTEGKMFMGGDQELMQLSEIGGSYSTIVNVLGNIHENPELLEVSK
jgi:hypothetical protein